MEKLDLKDRKILYHLDIDSRQSFRSIGRKVGLSKDIVASRVKKLQDGGIILSYFTSIDSSKLGYISFRFYLKFQHINPKIEKEIIEYFVKNKNVWWVTSMKGKFDLAVAIWIKNINDFHSFWEETLNKYQSYFQEQFFTVYLQLITYKLSCILDKEYEKADREKFEIAGGGKKIEIDKIDYQILGVISTNARIPIVEIAKKLHSTSKIVQNRIKNLVKLGVIQGYRINLDMSKLGYQFFSAHIKLLDYKKRGEIINYVKLNPHMLIITKTAGFADLEIDFVVKNMNHFLEIMNDLTIKFPKIIKSYEYFYQTFIHKIQYFPQELIE